MRAVEEHLAGDDALVTAVEEHELVWIVQWQSAAYLRTGDPRHMLAGNGPYLVDRVDGGLYEVGPVSWLMGDWELDYRTRVRGLPDPRTDVDDLHADLRATAGRRGRIYAMHLLRARLPALAHADVVAYVDALLTGEPPELLYAVAREALLPPVDPVCRVTTIRRGESRPR